MSLRASHDELDVSAIARKAGGGGHRQAAGFSSDASVEEITDVHPAREFARAAARRLSPSGLVLVDKPAGPVVVRDRRAACAGAPARGPGHAGTLDPFATGLLLVLSGSATRLAPYFVGLDKRYVTEVDLSSAHVDTGDPEGEVVEEREPPDAGRARAAGSRASAARSSCRSRPPRR